MAAKTSQENSERRFKSVSEYLENSNPKKALQELEKILKKTNDDSCIGLAFKALCLIRLSRADEAEPILDQLCTKDGELKDENTLQLLQFCFRETQREDRIAMIYENLTKKQPQNEELLGTLFNCHVRQLNFKRTQEVALRLSKLNPGRVHYSFNAAASLLLQAETAWRTEAERAMHFRVNFPLAIRMLEKHVNDLNDRRKQLESRFFSERTTYDSDLIGLYAIALEKMQRYSEAQEVLEQYRQFFDQDPVFFTAKSVELLRSARRWIKLFAFCESYLDEDREAWLFIEGYISASIEFISSNDTPTSDSAEATIAERITLSNVIDRLYRLRDGTPSKNQNGEQSNKKNEAEEPTRASRLALLELATRACAAGLREKFEQVLASRGLPPNVQQFLVDAAFDYFVTFSTKPCCFEDLAAYLSAFDEASREQLATRCQKLVTEQVAAQTQASEQESVEAQKSMQTVLSLEQLVKSLENGALKQPHSDAAVCNALQLYIGGLKFGRELPLTELQFADVAMLVAALRLDEMMRASRSAKQRDALATLLSGALQRSPHNHFFKLCLVRLFAIHFNAAQLSHRLMDSMSIKNVQMGTMAHYVLFDLHRCGLFNAAAAFNSQLLKFYTAGARDCAEFLTNAFRIGQYFQLNDIIRYRMHLARSLEFAIAKVDASFFQLLQADDYKQINSALAVVKTEDLSKIIAQTAGAQPNMDADSGFTDLRDLSVFTPLRHDERDLIARSKRETFEDEHGYLRLRALELSILKAIASDQQADTLATLANNINELLSSVNTKTLENEAYERDLYTPSKTMLAHYARAKLGVFWTSLVDFATKKLAAANGTAGQNGVASHLDELTSWFRERINIATNSFKTLEACGAVRFETLVVLVHALGCLAVTFAIIRNRTRPSATAGVSELQSKMSDLAVKSPEGQQTKKNKKKQKATNADSEPKATASDSCAHGEAQSARVLCTELDTCLRDAATCIAAHGTISMRMSDIVEQNTTFTEETRAAFARTLETIWRSGKLFWDARESRLIEAAASDKQTLQFPDQNAFGDYLFDALNTGVRNSYTESLKQLRSTAEKHVKLLTPTELS